MKAIIEKLNQSDYVNFFYKILLEQHRDGIVVLDEHGAVFESNATFAKMLGYTHEEVKKLYVWDWEAGLDKKTTLDMVKNVNSEGDFFTTQHIRKNKTIFHVEISTTASFIENKKFILCICRDITEKIKIKSKLNHAHLLMRYIIEHNRSAIAVHDKDMNYIFVSDRYIRDYNVANKNIIGKNHYEVFPDLPQKWRDVHQRVLKGEVVSEEDDPFVRQDGTVDWTRWECRPWFEEDGNIGGLIVYTEVINAQKNAEQVLIKEKEKAEAATKAKSAFLANMSHELRTPLNGIVGVTQLLKTSEMNEEQIQFLDLILKSSNRLARLLSDILDISKIESEMLTIRNEKFCLNELIESIEETFQISAKENNTIFECLIDCKTPTILSGDLERLRQIMFNFVGNAIKFSKNGQVIFGVSPIRSWKANKVRLLFSIEDTGIGISETDLKKLFNPFVQVENTYTRNYQGAGLGLSIAKKLTHLMKGNICIDTALNEGTNIYVALYFDKQPDRLEYISTTSNFPNSNLRSMNILLAEDDPSNRLPTYLILQKFGHTVSLAENGKQVLEMISKNDFDLIFMDIQMPIMNGVEATIAIRALEERKNMKRTPIIAMTAYAMDGDRDKFLGAGMDDYLSKPLNIREMEKVLTDVMVGNFQK